MKKQFRAKVWKAGNSYVITIPSKFRSWFRMNKGDTVEIQVSKIRNKKKK